MAKATITREWDETPGAEGLVYTMADGTKGTFAYHSLPEATKVMLGLHGLEQKVFDSIAGDTKKGATQEQLMATLAKTYEPLVGGEWSGKRGSSDGPGLPLLTEALSRMAGISLEEMGVRLAGTTVEARREMAKLPQVAAQIAGIRAERAKAVAEKAEGQTNEALAALLSGR